VDWTININQWLHAIHKGCIKIGRFYIVMSFYCLSGRRGHHRMVIGFITTYAISVYHHSRCEGPKEKGQKNKQWSTEHYAKIKIEQREPYIKPGWTQVRLMLVLRETRQKWWFHMIYNISLFLFTRSSLYTSISVSMTEFWLPLWYLQTLLAGFRRSIRIVDTI
jgi:hypothetical protein